MRQNKITIQTSDNGEWHDVADVTFNEPEKGIRGSTRLEYKYDWYFRNEPNPGTPPSVFDGRSVSVNIPLSLDSVTTPHWPAFLIDMLPQGTLRSKIVSILDSKGALTSSGHGHMARPDNPSIELPLLCRAAGSPIGNLRIKEAAIAEEVRLNDYLSDFPWVPLLDSDISACSDRLVETISEFVPQWATGSGAQGEWPKAQLIRTSDGRWYPASLYGRLTAKDNITAEWFIVKLLRSNTRDDKQILTCEAPWLEIARLFGVHTGAALRCYPSGVLVIPRFDRASAGNVYGQESIFSALGCVDNSVTLYHEHAIRMLAKVSYQPLHDICDYVLRDALNIAMGNPDNHGRNTALLKRGKEVSLAPLFDFAPMCIDATTNRRMTWECSKHMCPDGYVPDWNVVFENVAQILLEEGRSKLAGCIIEALRNHLTKRITLLCKLPGLMRALGVPDDIRDRALLRLPTLVDSLKLL